MTLDQLKRLINPNTNPALIPWLFSAALAAWQGFETAPGPLSWAKVGRVLGPVLIGLAVGYQRSKTTPVADPRDGNGQPLNTHAVIHVTGDPTKQPAIITPSGPIAEGDIEKLKADWQRVFGVQVPPSTTTTGAAK